MHMQVVTFQLSGISHEDYVALCDDLAPTVAAVPGLISKIFLCDPTSGTYGGVMAFESAAACAAYQRSELVTGFVANPTIINLVSREFDVLEGPTSVTHGLAGAAV